jgi:hypothetical protein
MGMTQDEDRFHEHVQRLVRELDPAPEVPREEIWARIQAAQQGERGPADGPGVIDIARRRTVLRRAARWALPLAATLALGIALGRLTMDRTATPSPLASADAAAADSAALLPYRMVAAQHLERTEALLTALPTDARAGQAAEVAGWAGDLLTDTRLLMDSPAARDPEMLRLLQDLELVLAQIAALPPEQAESEVELIQDGMESRYVLLRLRAATAQANRAAS